MKIDRGGCTVRCYRHGLGDCFLLGFANRSGNRKFMLIDCGVLTGTKNANAEMKKVAEDIKAVTGGSLDALVVTHEHWDHISGFSQARKVFKQIKASELWLAWTEDPNNALAKELRERKRAALRSLTTLEGDTGFSTSDYGKQIVGLMDFYGERLAAGGRPSSEGTMDWIKQRWTKHRYCSPGGAPLRMAGLRDVSFFVLGPPEDNKFIRKSRPSKKGDQVYLNARELKQAMAALRFDDRGAGRDNAPDSQHPFNPAYQIKFDTSGKATDGRKVSTSSDTGQYVEVDAARKRYNEGDWRQIESDWLQTAGELALRLDAHTNNTSLVLAIELSPGGKVLLFPADAQVGNWLSWHTVTWPEHDSALTARDLLERVCFYKVGHHASHNATLNKQGLELMTNPELEAFIPLDRDMAKKRKWDMPYPPLFERMGELTGGRLYLADQELTVDQASSSHLKQTDLYLDISFKP